MIPPLVEKGYRVIAPDLIGFGKSDKFVNQSDHSYQLHVSVITKLIETLELNNINLFIQDWGSIIGLRCVHNLPDRFSRIILANGGLAKAKKLAAFVKNAMKQQKKK